MFYYAWCDSDELTFNPATHKRVDEQVFSFNMPHVEGEFPSLDVDLVNPRVGLLASTRKQWVWLSWEDPEGVTWPLFFGRLVGVPQDIQDDVVRLTFVARPVDYEQQRDALALTLQVAPYYDPVWLSDQERLDPDRVLEGYSRLWHIDRITHLVTVSDIITGEDGQIDLEPSEVFYDSVSVSYSQSPARSVYVEATVQWSQQGHGFVDVTNPVLKAFDAKTPNVVTTPAGNTRPSKGMMSVLGGEQAINAWPKQGARLGGGWSVELGTAEVIGDIPIVPTNVGTEQAWGQVRGWINLQEGVQRALRDTFEKTPGIIAQIQDTTSQFNASLLGEFSGDIKVLWLPIWRIAVKLVLRWDASRDRTETVRFTLNGDVQPLMTDPGQDETVMLQLGPVDVDNYIGDRRRSRYFATDRGSRSFQYLLALARAHLLARARAVDVSFEVPFALGVALSLRKSLSIQDPRIPGGIAAGKIKSYQLSADGDSGKLGCTITIGCTVGRNGNIVAVDGDPTYVELGYVAPGYQVLEDQVVVPIAGEVGYSGLANYPIDDDGVNLQAVTAQNHLLSVTYTGGLLEQEQQLTTGVPATTGQGSVSGFKSSFQVAMRPVEGGPFLTIITPTLTELAVPRTIDLEAEA